MLLSISRAIAGETMGPINWQWVRESFGISAIVRLVETVRSQNATILDQNGKLEKLIMATTEQVLAAIDASKEAILSVVSAESAEIVAALEKAKSGATPEDLQAIIDRVNGLQSSVTSAVSGLVTPEVEPAPAPVEPAEPTV